MECLAIDTLKEYFRNIDEVKKKIVSLFVEYEYNMDIAESNPSIPKPVLNLGDLGEQLLLYVSRTVYELNVYKAKNLELIRPSIKNHIIDVFNNKCNLDEEIINSNEFAKIFYKTIEGLGQIDKYYIPIFLQSI